MKIGVVIRAYNVEKYLSRAILSLRQQTYKEFEAVIVDDGSTDMTSVISDQVIKEDVRFSYVRVERKGCVLATCAGVDALNSEYIAILDGDDAYEPDYLEQSVRLITSHNPDIVVNGLLQIDEGGMETRIAPSEETRLVGKDEFLDFMLQTSMYGIAYKVMRRNLFCYDDWILTFFETQSLRLNYDEDVYQIIPMVCKADKILLNHQPLYRYYFRLNSLSHEVKLWKDVQSIVTTMGYMEEILEKNEMLTKNRTEALEIECIRKLIPYGRLNIKRPFQYLYYQSDRVTGYYRRLLNKRTISVRGSKRAHVDSILVKWLLLLYDIKQRRLRRRQSGIYYNGSVQRRSVYQKSD